MIKLDIRASIGSIIKLSFPGQISWGLYWRLDDIDKKCS